ncbi:putative GDSL-like lipase acylhydrolase [Rosellinia necatrix]|uniref:Putative GDSL-like lipase acylhydrolase n=1 Tax=Rosellinia necatrix TaxID=77044 RepID=A0A1W2TNU1_ROSNE|nr:putative GDSL-like lipase acylhydrolase [Rosellinia necatrix]
MAKPYDQIVLFGDSLFQGSSNIQDGFSFQGALQHLCMRGLDVINRGFSGYNTNNALELLPDIFLPPSPTTPRIKYLLVLLGANDACLPIPTSSQGVPIDQYKENLIKIVTHEHIRSHSPTILLVTPPPLDEVQGSITDRQHGHMEPVRRSAVSARYSQTAREVAAEVPGVVLIDLQKALMEKGISMTPDYDPSGPLLGSLERGDSGGLKRLLPDGLHMSGEAYRVFFEIVKPHIKLPTNFYVYPDWRIMNPGNI